MKNEGFFLEALELARMRIEAVTAVNIPKDIDVSIGEKFAALDLADCDLYEAKRLLSKAYPKEYFDWVCAGRPKP